MASESPEAPNVTGPPAVDKRTSIPDLAKNSDILGINQRMVNVGSQDTSRTLLFCMLNTLTPA